MPTIFVSTVFHRLSNHILKVSDPEYAQIQNSMSTYMMSQVKISITDLMWQDIIKVQGHYKYPIELGLVSVFKGACEV